MSPESLSIKGIPKSHLCIKPEGEVQKIYLRSVVIVNVIAAYDAFYKRWILEYFFKILTSSDSRWYIFMILPIFT